MSLFLWTDWVFILILIFLFQLSELEQRVLDAEGRAEEAEDKVCIKNHFS